MRKLLPIFLSCIVFITLTVSLVHSVFASAPAITPPAVDYTDDAEVNFVGKTAARSVSFLNWTLQNYQWACVSRVNLGDIDAGDPATDPKKLPVGSCRSKPDPNNPNIQNPLSEFWIKIRNIVYAFFALIVLITAFVLIVTRGKSLTIQRFLPRFIAVVLLVTFSYAIIQFLYTTTDLIQGFFLTKSASTGQQKTQIDATDLLYVGWSYENFRGLRKIDPYYDESVFVNLLLARITAVTYYVMTGILIIRKIILWFFIILSPVFPILMLYYPVRNTAKIWIGEFFRWLLYAPLFAIFLSGLVKLWQTKIPLQFNFSGVGTRFVYPTATNILLGGPGQTIAENNNLNLPDTFALYIVALIMLWVVVLLPFVLLQIFLDYLNNFSFTESPAFQKILNTSYALMNRSGPQPFGPVPSGPPGTTGLARDLPFAKFSAAKIIPDNRNTGSARDIPIGTSSANMQKQINADILNAASISLPTIRDIAMYEREMLAQHDSQSINKTYEALRQIANPNTITNVSDRSRMLQVKDKLLSESQNGNVVADAVISASRIASNISNIYQTNTFQKTINNITNPQSVSSNQQQLFTKLHETLTRESQQGNVMASTILAAKQTTSVRELQRMKEQLTRESIQGNSISSSVLATTFTQKHNSVLQNVLNQAANPATVPLGVDKQRITSIHDALTNEQKQGNPLAGSILSGEKTNNVEIMREKLIEAALQGDQAASQILSTVIMQMDATTTQKVLQEIAHPDSITNTAAREKFVKVKEKLVQAQQQNDPFATTMLSTINAIPQVSATMPEAPVNEKEMQDVKEKLLEAKEKGQPLANEIASLFASEGEAPVPSFEDSLPQSNRVQAVSLEDYEAVRKMWQENYKNMDIPAGLTDRKGWISDEVNSIDTTIALLTSPDPEKVKEGMQEVGNILPFLLLGGFSQAEIVAYLKAKKEAGKSVVEDLAKDEAEEDTMVSVEKRKKTQTATMAQEQTVDTADTAASSTFVDDDSPLASLTSQPDPSNTQLLQLTDLTLPTIRDLTKFDISYRTQMGEVKENREKIEQKLRVIGDPHLSEIDQEKMEQIRSTLQQQQEKGDTVANLILQASQSISTGNNSATIILPASNPVQVINADDLALVSTMWKDFYIKADMPSDTHDRKQWVQNETEATRQLLSSLMSNDQAKLPEVLHQLINILPFILLGGFTQAEISAYINAKLQGAMDAISSL